MRKPRIALAGVLVVAIGLAAAVALLARDDDGSSETAAEPEVALLAASSGAITEDKLPQGFEKTPTVELDGKEWSFDDVPGHYWKVLDDRGFAVALHFQTEEPFKWAKDVPAGELLYMVYAIPGNCGDGSFEKASKSPDASIVGPLPAGFDHWHALVGGGSETGHWLMHIPVRDFTLAGPEGNPMTGTEVKAANPGFIPVCDIR